MNDPKHRVLIDYTNHAGKRSVREISPLPVLTFGNTEWHPETQWLLDAVDVTKGDLRTFAMKDIHRWGVEPGRQMDIDLSIAAQLQRSMELNARMKRRLLMVRGQTCCSNEAARLIESVLKDEEPTWPPA